jgi:hypothetical protein
MYICADCASCCSRVETALVVDARESGLEGPCCERDVCVRCLAAIVFMMLLELVREERAPGASADWAGFKCLMSTNASCSSEMVTGTAQPDQMSYLGETASRRVSMGRCCRREVALAGSQKVSSGRSSRSRVGFGGQEERVSRPGRIYVGAIVFLKRQHDRAQEVSHELLSCQRRGRD